ncbi:glycosyltransferase family 39 protein [bacterium]|nr:glycosyltransferase family 39 protein [bacterium]
MNLALLHRAQLCDEANIEFGRLCCPIVKYNKWPNAYPYILSIIYRMFGVREIWAFIINNFLTSVHVLMIFFIYFNLFDNQKAALFSGLCFALIPMNSMWGNTAAVEPGAAFFNTLTVCAWTFSLKTNRKFILLLSILLTAFSIQFRLESVLLIPVIGVLVLLKKPGVYLQTSFWLFVLIAVILVIPVFGHYYAVQDEPWGARNQARFGIQYIETNLHSNIFYFFDIDRFPVLVTIIAILGSLWISFSKERSFLILWFFAFWGIFIFFYAGSYEYGADIRYSLVAYAPLILLAGYGIQALDNSMFVKNRRFSMTTVVCILLVVHFSWLIPLIRSEGEEAWEARLDHQYVEEIAEYLPDNSLVFTHNPNMFFIKGINAAQIYLALNADKQRMEEYFSRYKGGVYIHWNFWCNTLAPEEVKLCERVLAKYKVEKIMEKEFWRVHYILYEIVDCAKETEYQ